MFEFFLNQVYFKLEIKSCCTWFCLIFSCYLVMNPSNYWTIGVLKQKFHNCFCHDILVGSNALPLFLSIFCFRRKGATFFNTNEVLEVISAWSWVPKIVALTQKKKKVRVILPSLKDMYTCKVIHKKRCMKITYHIKLFLNFK